MEVIMTISNYSSFDEFNNVSLGKINESKNEVSIKDYIEITQSKGLGRLFTKIKLAIKGKGWLDHQKLKNLAQKMDWETIERVHSQSQAILGINSRRRALIPKPGRHQIVGDETTIDYKVTKKDYKKNIKSLDKEEAIAVAINQLLKETVEEKEKAIRDEFKFLEKFTIDELNEHPNLGKVFQDYMDFLTDQNTVNALHSGRGKLEIANKIVSNPNASNSYNEQVLVKGFIEYLTEKKMENRLTQPEQTAIRMAQNWKVSDLKIINILDKIMQDPELAQLSAKGRDVLVQVMGKMNSFWEEREGEAVEITEPEERRELTMERVKYLKEKFTNDKGVPLEEFKPLLAMIEIIAVKNLEDESHSALKHFFDDSTLADCNNGEDIYKLIQETYQAITA
jgi:hypothetical protein